MSARATRRTILGGLTATALAAPALAQAKPAIVVVGGGYGGVTAARELVRLGLGVTLVEPSATYTSCPSSNAVIAGLMPLSAVTFDYAGVRRAGVTVVQDRVTAIEADGRRVHLAGEASLAYDRLVMSPGVAMRFDAIPGYDEAASLAMPHAWKAGAQTDLLMRQLAAMEDGGLVVISAPGMPYRCPPGPYERASLIAHFLKTRKPRSKVIVLDAKDKFSKQPLFEAAWKTLYPDHLEWVPAAKGGRLKQVDAGAMVIEAEGGRFTPAVANVIPPQRAPALCFEAGLADAYGWCRIDPITFESIRVPGIHVLGDASAAGAMPKSAFSANAQAKVCAQAVADLCGSRKPDEPRLINVCYSLAAPDYGFSVAGVYAPEWDALVSVLGAGGLSPDEAPVAFRAKEAALGAAWYRTITRELFG
ncbi:NAD(P)/FAD-dependent oxidoreductase [Methylobacterium gnaphalii]|uniref:Cytochrome c n=1 Tax=Methylobacterium gnaphalii TaxID=1010610 RepID=A0A512JES7_9HYPH|nr:NAD(P)/FAD-dependent oxidoreductase [Methylobacterium gnaphalii]GEP08441.1 cytochrome c [Methylobacterium gnaphalii]GJD68846.1 Sulfide dehydrogenase [flavocytochrome c] flavoprotein chain [Methylobacterium gnaphalii]GLS47370.1 cytochrome c [Methylobacterium gnaphalii]